MAWTINQVLILVVFVIPGFVLVRVKRLSYPPAGESFELTLLESLTLSCIVHGLASPGWYWSYASGAHTRRPVVFGLTVFAILFGIPVLLGLLHNLLAGSGGARWLRGIRSSSLSIGEISRRAAIDTPLDIGRIKSEDF